jgi:hypothetical protein
MANQIHLSIGSSKVTLKFGASSFFQRRRPLNKKTNDRPVTSSYFLGASAGAGAAGVAAGAGGAGASAGLASSLTAGFSGALGLHPIPMEAILITKTNARNRKTHFFICLHLLSSLNGRHSLPARWKNLDAIGERDFLNHSP